MFAWILRTNFQIVLLARDWRGGGGGRGIQLSTLIISGLLIVSYTDNNIID